MSESSFPERLFGAGFTDLVSVIPPGAQLMPTSKISQASVGKSPGRRHKSGLYAGYDWRKHEPVIDDVRRWYLEGSNVGLRAGRFPGIDIDCTDANLSQLIEDAVRSDLGPAPVRTGRAPKRLMMYRTDEPFSRMRLQITVPGGAKYLVEILGEGQQYLVYGMHPSGNAYTWDHDPDNTQLTTITRQQASDCLDTLQAMLEQLGIGVIEREGDGRRQRTIAKDQTSLMAPSIEALQECVTAIPNSDGMFHDRADYIRIAYAIKAAAGAEHEEDGYEIFADWAARWDGGYNAPETVRADWRGISGEKAVGWGYLAQLARRFGFNDAAYEFDVVAEAPTEKEPDAEPFSDMWLAEQIIVAHLSQLRYVPQRGSWLVWDGARWKMDADLAAEDIIARGLKKLAAQRSVQGATTKERAEASRDAKVMCSTAKRNAVAEMIRCNRAVAVAVESLDHNPMILNTPAGVVDLVTGKLLGPDRNQLATKQTSVRPEFNGPCPEWRRFLAEATGGNRELENYLQRFAGYALTGDTSEQQLTFIYGEGDNGKSLFIGALGAILGDYTGTANASTFTVSMVEGHTTDIADLKGARLVTSNETTQGKRWDEQRLKSLTGGDKIKARFMRQDNFVFRPEFKLLFAGNHKPEIREVGRAMRRRIQMVPFTVTPAKKDTLLNKKLEVEYPAILAWMIEGCLEWQKQGLNPPPAVTTATDEYFEDEDAIGSWIHECIEAEEGAFALTQDLFASWEEYANPRKEYVGSMKRLASALKSRGWKADHHSVTRRAGFTGIRILTGNTEFSMS